MVHGRVAVCLGMGCKVYGVEWDEGGVRGGDGEKLGWEYKG